MYKTALALLALLAIEIALVWRPFDTRLLAYDSGTRGAKVAGEMVEGFRLTQEVPGKLFSTRLPRRPITHWKKSHAYLYTREPNCFALRFATYARRNEGHVLVDWAQGSRSQRWRLDVSALDDNAPRDFCPIAGLDASRPFRLDVAGIDSRPGYAATLWLARSRLKPAVVDGKRVGKRGVALQLTRVARVGPGRIARLDHGAFAFACLSSLAIGLVTIVAVRQDTRDRR